MQEQADVRKMPDGTYETLDFCEGCNQETTWRKRDDAPWFCSSCGLQEFIDNDDLSDEDDEDADEYERAPEPVQISWLLLVSACIAIISALLPWISAASGLVDISHNGIQNGATDGWAGVGIGIIIAIWELVFLSGQQSPNRVTAVIQAILAGLLGVVAVYDVVDITDKVNDFNSLSTATASVGVGVYLMAIAAGLLLIGSAWRFISD